MSPTTPDPPPPDHTLPAPPRRPVRDNPFAGFTLLLVLAGLVPPLRTVAWGMALVSGALGIIASGRGGGRKQLSGAAAIVLLALAAPHARRPDPPARVATAPRPAAEPAEPVEPAKPAARPRVEEPPPPAPKREAPPRRRPRPTPKPKPKPRPKPRPAATPTRTPTRTVTTTTRTTRPAPRPAPRRTPPKPAPRPAPEITTLRASLAVAESQMNQGAYTEAAATIRAVQRQAAPFPEVQQYARVLAIENRQACRAEAEALRRRGESVRGCP